ncbi:hypothetical protein [Terriglobus sp. TAA 43]|uniref:hypothetical protein n=1 Tax=Terriglobus sp. TAA 43 TaxID=278961 RepID=UPI00064612CB|nr:hypothetical protein [Terriglobus sp. TAA 43]
MELFLPLAVVMFVGLWTALIIDSFVTTLMATAICYTAFIGLMTFSAYRGQQPFFFGCPYTESVLPKLFLRHGAYLAAVLLLELVAFLIRGYLPAAFVVARGKTPPVLGATLFSLTVVLALVQALTNRQLLARAHHEP